jgi:serine/threonine protein kinase
MLCPHCQKDLAADASFCHSCGASLNDDATRRMLYRKPASKSSTSFDSIDDARFVPGTILAERYRIVGLLGKGGMGEVYRADDLKLSQPVALKFLPQRYLSDGAALARFHREVRVARQVSHRNVCRVYDIGEIDGQHFLSMEYIKGEELSSLLRRIGRLPSDKALQIARQMCAGLAAAHESGILHRDLKPSNVMIDDYGNARITDFGLAGLADEFREDEIVAGTPGYMAPEQFDGQAPTVRSDIFSLGLVLYELFTGKRAYDAATLGELIKLRRSDTTPTTPTSIVKDLDPVIERVIERCTEKDPASRPSSALQVAAALPGGDPIAAALAAGETPSPEMVAAAPKKGTLKPAVALGLLAAFVSLVLLSMWLSKYGTLHRSIPLNKSPEVLKEQAWQIAKSFGYTANADRKYSFTYDLDLYQYLEDRLDSLNPKELLRTGQPALMYFWYRQGPLPLVPYDTQFIDMDDPPNEIPGMVRMSLDTEGRLIYFDAVPEQVQTPVATVPASSQGQNQHFETLFRLAGLDIDKFQPIASEWTPPSAYDERQAWAGVFPALPQIPIRIEAAAFHGKPIYFEVVSPWTKPLSQPWEPTSRQKAGTWILLVLFFVIVLVAALLALSNLRNGRGDRKGALRLGLFFFVVRMVFWVMSTHHVATTSEFFLLLTGLQSALFWSSFLALLYLALEPYLRRRWPQRIISWSRLVAGDFRDPMIGRDVLIGAVLGGLCVSLSLASGALTALTGRNNMPHVIDGFETSLFGIGAFSQLLIGQVSASLVQALMIVFLLLLLSLLLRRDWLGIATGTIILASIVVTPVIGREPLPTVIMILGVVLILVFGALRFGPIALFACLTVFHLWVFFPITSDFSAWYATAFMVDVVFLFLLAIYGYYISLGGQPMFSGKLLRED